MSKNSVSCKVSDAIRAKVWFKYNLRLLMPENHLRAMKAIDEAVVLARQDAFKEVDNLLNEEIKKSHFRVFPAASHKFATVDTAFLKKIRRKLKKKLGGG